MSKYLKFVLIVISLAPKFYGQNKWIDYGLDSFSYEIAKDLSVDSLRSLIVNDKIDSSPLEYGAAVKYLYYKHRDSQAHFLLENLNTKIDTTLPVYEKTISWDKYYNDAYILGLLGDPSAIDKMDSVARYSNYSMKEYAIARLAEIGRYDYYDYVKEKCLSGKIVITLLAMYGRDNRYKNEVRSILEERLNSIDPNDWMKVSSMISNFSYFDPDYEIEKLNEYFKNTTGEIRYYYFFELGKIDVEGQPERSRYCLLNELDDDLREEYLPSLYGIKVGWDSKQYLEPNFIKFISELPNLVPGSDTYHNCKEFLSVFKPLPPDSLTPIPEIIDKLMGLTDTVYNYSWLNDATYTDELKAELYSAKDYLSSSDSIDCANQIKSFQSSIMQVYSDSAGSHPKYVNQYAYKFLYYYPQYILDRLPSLPTVKLKDSRGNLLPGGALQYYEGGWKNATDNGDGTFSVDTKLKTVSLRMTYEYGSQTKSNVAVGTDTVVFQTVNALVKLQDSNGNAIDTGKVQYYAGGWRTFGQTINGTASKELLAANYTFRMSYAFASNDKAQNLDTNSTVIFRTTNTNVELRNSLGNLIDVGMVQYYSGGWREFGPTTNGISSKELLPNNYTFRMSYGFASNDKAQNTGTNPTVVFQTVSTNVELRNSIGNLMDNGTVQYYSGGWREFGVALNGVASKELLPNNYTFRMSYGFASNDKAQNIGINSTVVFQTVNAKVELRNSLGNLIDNGTVQYYSGGWRTFGTTENGVASKELLANNYTFRMTNEFISNDKQQNIGTNNIVAFQTINCIVRVKNQQSQPINNARASYYSGGWRVIGNTVNGEINKELLPANLTFRINSGAVQQDKTQNLSSNNLVEFTINQ